MVKSDIRPELRKYLTVSVIILIPVMLIFLIAGHYALNESYHKSEFKKLGAYDNIGKEKADITLSHILSYLKDESQILKGDFDETELFHMKEVKSLFLKAKALRAALALFLIIFLIMLLWCRKFPFRTVTLYSGLVSIGIVLFFLVCGTMLFWPAFELFHKIFFTEGTWAFDSSQSLLKSLFPDEFFSRFVLRTGAMMLISGIFLTSLAFIKDLPAWGKKHL